MEIAIKLDGKTRKFEKFYSYLDFNQLIYDLDLSWGAFQIFDEFWSENYEERDGGYHYIEPAEREEPIVVVGWRFGAAPVDSDGNFRASYNRREQTWEPGVSLAQALYLPATLSVATVACKDARAKRYYYEGVFAGVGSDGEICVKKIKPITYNEFRKRRAQLKDDNNRLIDKIYNRHNAEKLAACYK